MNMRDYLNQYFNYNSIIYHTEYPNLKLNYNIKAHYNLLNVFQKDLHTHDIFKKYNMIDIFWQLIDHDLMSKFYPYDGVWSNTEIVSSFFNTNILYFANDNTNYPVIRIDDLIKYKSIIDRLFRCCIYSFGFHYENFYTKITPSILNDDIDSSDSICFSCTDFPITFKVRNDFHRYIDDISNYNLVYLKTDYNSLVFLMSLSNMIKMIRSTSSCIIYESPGSLTYYGKILLLLVALNDSLKENVDRFVDSYNLLAFKLIEKYKMPEADYHKICEWLCSYYNKNDMDSTYRAIMRSGDSKCLEYLLFLDFIKHNCSRETIQLIKKILLIYVFDCNAPNIW